MLKIPKSYLTPYLSYICTWLSRRYIGSLFKAVNKKQNLLNSIKTATKRIKHTITQFRAHCERKRDAFQRLSMLFYEELQNVSKWETKIDPGFSAAEQFTISHNLGLYTESYVTQVLERYIDYEFLEYSKRTKCERPVISNN